MSSTYCFVILKWIHCIIRWHLLLIRPWAFCCGYRWCPTTVCARVCVRKGKNPSDCQSIKQKRFMNIYIYVYLVSYIIYTINTHTYARLNHRPVVAWHFDSRKKDWIKYSKWIIYACVCVLYVFNSNATLCIEIWFQKSTST